MAVNALAGLARETASSPFMRGLTALPYRLAGAPVDLADMVVRPIANAAGIPIAEPENMYGTSDWMIKQAIDAGLLMPRTDTGAEMAGDFLGQLAAPGVGPAEAGTMKAIFAGPLALTADHDALARAAARLDAGDDPAKVWAEEGWFRGPDGKMRFEIDDSQAQFDPSTAAREIYDRRAREGDVLSLSDVTSHPALFDAYPEMADQTVGFMPKERMRGASAAFSPRLGRYTFPEGRAASDAKERSFGIHEMQHDVQAREGWQSGGSLKDLTIDQYMRLIGEAEARATQARLPLTAEQRRARYPLQDYDVPLDELIIRR